MISPKKILSTVFIVCGVSAANALDVANLRVEYRNNPIGIDTETPHFSWQLSSYKRATVQTAYQVVLATDAAMASVVYDSGNIEGSESANVVLSNLTLEPETRYYWAVTVTDNHGETATSPKGFFFETGLMGSGWSGAKWIAPANGQTVSSNLQDVSDYVIEYDFEIQRAAAGLIWGAKDRNNFYMWQFNVQDGKRMFRPHVWKNGTPECIAEISLSQPLERMKTHHAKIEVTDGGTKVLTYLDGTLIDERTGQYPYGALGMRASNINGNMHQPECAWYDDFKVTSADGTVLYLDNFDTNVNYGTGVIENGQLNITGSEPQTLVFQNNFTPDNNVKNYTFEGTFTIEQYCAGIVFAAKDNANFTMWQFNLENGFPRFRPHVWSNGNAACLAEIDLSNIVSLDAYTPHAFKIVVSEDGRRCTTYIDDIEIDSRPGNFAYGMVGFRHSRSEREWTIYERALFDNLNVTTPEGEVLYSEDFGNPDDVTITGGAVDNGALLLDGNSEIYAWSPFSTSETKLRYDIEADMTLIKDAASIIFSRTKSNCYFMWTVNTNDNGYPILRRHVYANSSDPKFSDVRLTGMTNNDFLGKERHLKLEVDGNVVRTYIDGDLIDTFSDNTGLLTKGLMGFRVYHDKVDERAYWDNVVMTVYGNDDSKRVTISEDFESDNYEFSSGEVVDVNGNRKLYSYSPIHETIVLQDAGTSSPRFRKSFNLGAKVRKARIYSSALGVYNLYINGVRVGELQSDGTTVYDELMPGWTDYRSSIFYLTHDVTNLLREGDNAIGAEVSSGWWLGQVSHGIYGSTGLAFIGKLVVELENGETVTIVTDPSWLWSADGAIKSGEIYHGENYDARKAELWTAPDYDTAMWESCIEDSQSKGTLMAQEGPTLRILPNQERKPLSLTVYDGIKANGTQYGEINVVETYSAGTPVNLKKGQTIVVDFGQNASGWAKFKVKGKAGVKVNLRFAEMVNDSGDTERGNDGAKGSLYTIALRSAKAQGLYILNGDKDGEVYRPTTTFYGFRYCDFTASDDITLEWITAETISTANEEGSYVKVDENDVNQLYSNILWGQRSNFVSVPTDCPQRDERLGWTADTQVFSMAASYNAQVQGFYHKWMRDMRDGQLATGQYPNVAPFNWVEHGSSAWADAGIIMPWNVYVMYGDKAIIEENYESMTKYMDWLATQKEGNYKHIGSDTRYGDWLAFEDTDKRLVSVSYYGYMADIMSRMASVMSQSPDDKYAQDAEKYARLFEEIKVEFKNRYWSPRQNKFNPNSQCALLMALRYNLLHNEEAVEKTRQALRTRIENNGYKLATGFLGTAILNQTLSEFGMDDLAYALLLQHECPSWLYSVDQGATTMWERWNSYTLEGGFSKSIEMNSFNHYAYGAVGEWMFRYMAGIAPDYQAPGFSHINLKPSFDPQKRITDVEAMFLSNYGPVKVNWTYGKEDSYSYNVTVPANATATLTLPLEGDQTIYEGGEMAKDAEGIEDYEEVGDKAIMTLGSGTYTFTTGQKPAGIKEVSATGLKVYPNPAKDIVNVVYDKEISTIELYSLDGHLVVKNSDTNFLNIASCTSGLYLLNITDAEGCKHIVKLIKH